MSPEIAIQAALVGVLYAVVLAGEDTPLNAWFDLLRAGDDRGGWRAWIAKPLGACERCFTGQLALWMDAYRLGWERDVDSVFGYLATAGLAVLFAHATATAYRWINRKM